MILIKNLFKTFYFLKDTNYRAQDAVKTSNKKGILYHKKLILKININYFSLFLLF